MGHIRNRCQSWLVCGFSGLLLAVFGSSWGCGQPRPRSLESSQENSIPPLESSIHHAPYAVDSGATDTGVRGAAGDGNQPRGPNGISSPRDASRERRDAGSGSLGSVMDILESLVPTRNTRPFNPADPRELHWLGDGYDVLNGERKESCLDPGSVTFRSYPINQAIDTMDLVFSKEELARKLSTQVNAEISGTYQGISFAPSLKATILRETNVSGSVLVAVASFVYAKDRISIYESVPGLDQSRASLLGDSKDQFREQCGDKFTKSIRTGVALFLIVRAEQVAETSHSQTEIQQAFKVGLGQLFGISPSVGVTNEQKDILSGFRLSTRCYSDGVSGHPCADNQLNLASFSVGDVPIFDRVSAAKKALASEAAERKVTAVLDEKMDYYPVPREERGSGALDVFFDYRPYLTKIRAWISLEDTVQGICQSAYRDQWAVTCEEATDKLAQALAGCAEQSEWPQGLCRSPQPDDFASLLDLDNAGSVEFLDNPWGQGRSILLNLSDLFGRGSRIRPNVVYSLHDDRFNFADQLSTIKAHLKAGWQIVFYEHVDGSGAKWVTEPGSEVAVNVPRWFNNKASSFVVKRAD